ncbi:MAG: TatD family hydrolase [Pyrodictiaceae archaeon]
MAFFRFIDAHIHLHEYDKVEDLINKLDSYLLVAVSDDLESSIKTIELWKNYPDIIKPCIGLHPWSVSEVDQPMKQAVEVSRLALRYGIDCIGEVGLDKRFVPDTIDKQLEVFKIFLDTALEVNATLNLHTPDAWEEVLDMIVSKGIARANFHWYTGPSELLKRIAMEGYTISVNPALRIQKKHREIVKKAELSIIVTESDAPYTYKGVRLSPLLIPETIELIAEIKALPRDIIAERIIDNAKRIFNV